MSFIHMIVCGTYCALMIGSGLSVKKFWSSPTVCGCALISAWAWWSMIGASERSIRAMCPTLKFREVMLQLKGVIMRAERLEFVALDGEIALAQERTERLSE